MLSVSDKLLVAALDLGTDDSRYGYSFIQEYNKDPTRVNIGTWNSGRSLSFKQPTCVLFNPDGQFYSFGYVAEDRYTELVLDNKHYKWYFFRKFKEMLAEKQVDMGFELTDVIGLKMPAIKVFSMAIRYLKDDLLNVFRLRGIDHLRENDIHWILPVPATWTVSAKELFREAATEAGIDGANLTIALEPVAAAVYCGALLSHSCGRRFDDDKYMVIDLGDSTSVFTVHEKQPNGTIIDIHKVSSRPWGSTKVNEEFTQMIISIFGDRTFKTFCDDNQEDLVDMLREVEIKYRKIDTNDNCTIFIRSPTTLEETYEEITGKSVQDAVEQSPYKGKIQWRRQKMVLDAELFRSFFKNYISNITNHIANLCQEPGVKGTSAFLIIGKFAGCRLVQDAVIKAFPKVKVVVINEPEVAVMKGAVVLGHKFGLTCGYNLRLQQPMNKDHSAVATTTVKRDEDDVSSDDNDNGSTCSSSYEKDLRNDQTKNLKFKSLSEEGEEALSSNVLEMTVPTQDKSTQGLETQLINQMTLEAAKEDEDDVYSDDNDNGSTCSSSYEKHFRNDQTKNLKFKSLGEEGEEALSSDFLEMTVQTQDESTQGLETQLKNQMTLEADNSRAPSDDELFALSRQLSKLDKEWWFLAKLLGLSDKQIDEIERGAGSKHIVRQYYQMLIAWKGHNEGQEKGSVRYLLRQCDEAEIDGKVTDAVFGN